MKNFIFYILKKKWIIKKNPKVDILFFDHLTEIKLENFKVEKYPKNIINIRYLIISFFKFIFLKKKTFKALQEIYFRQIIESFDPYICVGNETDKKSFDFMRLFSEKKMILYQYCSYWNIVKDGSKKNHVDLYGINSKKIKCDYFLIHDEWYKFFFDYFDTNFVVTGSVKNNGIIKNSNTKPIYDIMLISEFRTKVTDYYGTNGSVSTMRLSDVCISYISKVLNEYCREHNKKLTVALSSNRKDKENRINQSDEIDFFKKDIENFSPEKMSGNELAEKSNLSICLSSNLGPELIARQKKVLFLSINYFVLDWFFLKGTEGPYWYKGFDKEKIKEKISYLLNLDNKKWKKILDNSSQKIKYDPENKILKELIKTELSKNEFKKF